MMYKIYINVCNAKDINASLVSISQLVVDAGKSGIKLAILKIPSFRERGLWVGSTYVLI